MKKYLLIVYSIFLSLTAYSQVTTTPALPTDSDSVTVIFDATQGDKGLMGYTGNDVYAHTGVITDKSAGQWAYVISPWNVDIPKAKLTSLGNDKWQLKITPSIRAFYGVPSGEQILKLAFVFRNTGSTKTGRATGGADIFYTVYQAGLTVSIAQPQKGAIFTIGASVPVTVNVSNATKLRIYLDNNKIDSTAGTTYTKTLTGLATGNHTLIAVALSSTGTSVSDTSKFLISQPPSVAALPAGMRPGINYTGDNSACLVLYAPGKLNTYVIGDFNNWVPDVNYQMNITPDGKSFWINITNLTKGVEYGFQYLVDGTILIPDPYTEKVLDPWNDQYIPAATYPNLKPYPFNKTTGLVSIIQTGQTPYNWQVTNFTPPPQAKMVVYELLVRDFTDTHNFQGVQSKLDYLQHLGINTIELMPVTEFDGNISWGYNPALYFAPDKYYGPKNDLKALIDECHKRGLAVVMDMVLNHSYNNSPFAQLYWDAVNNRPAANNPWYNVTSPNPVYSYGNDFNHESPDTKALVDSVNAFWMQYYHVDGYRFDFTKGFTNTPGDGSAYDASRIAILERMGTQIWKRNPKAYAILEHFAANTEETELSAFGFMLWGNLNYNYAEGAMGYTDSNNSDLTWGSYLARGWSSHHLMSYMESHDEERQMYKVETYGNSFGSYNTKVDSIAFKRGALCASFFFTIPGPKMIWQFGELGYDYSINYCPSTGLVDATGVCRTDPKPLRWDYYTDPQRLKLFNIYSQLIRLKQYYPVFSTTDYSTDLTGVTKSIVLRSPGLNAVVVGNFGVTGTIASVIFPSTGTYYDYFSTSSINVSTVNQTFNLNPGEYHIYTNALISGIGSNPSSPANSLDVKIYPNPSSGDGTAEIISTSAGETKVEIYTMTGQKISATNIQLQPNTKFTLNLNQPGFNASRPGIYLFKVIQGTKTVSQKLIIS